MMTVGYVSLVDLFFVIACFMKFLSVLMLFSHFTEMISRFLVVIVCHLVN
ncbi:MAG: hypothetical protein JWP57_2748, partial [Spirosoma sp.]|nr:hypothetical protein [Spirosoma sp.]